MTGPRLRNERRTPNVVATRLSAASLAASASGTARVGPILSLPSVLTELGVTPGRAFAKARVDRRLFKSPDNRMPYGDLGRLLSVCTALTNCGHLGLLVGQRFTLEDFGGIGYLMRNSTSVGEALRVFLLRFYRYDRVGVPVLLSPEPSSMLLGYSVHRHDMPATAQMYDTAVAIGYRLLRELCGESWKPLRVQFAYQRPKDISPYRRFFSAPVRFDADVSGLVFAASWLEHRIAGADPALHDLLTRAIRGAEADGPMRFAEEVQCVLNQLVLSGASSAANVARFFGIGERTLRQRLRAERSSLQQLLDQARFELARELLRNTKLPLSEIAATLHYADPAVFSRAFRNWAGMSPREWRASHTRGSV